MATHSSILEKFQRISWTEDPGGLQSMGLQKVRQDLVINNNKYATGEEQRNNSRKNEGIEPKQKQCPVMDVTGDGSNIRCCKEQYCIEIWNVRSTNQGKSEVVKQEMARVNINILGIRELKWTAMGEFNSADHYIYYCGQASLKRNGVVLIVNRRV